VDQTRPDLELDSRQCCYETHTSPDGQINVLAHIVEHSAGWTMRLDRILLQPPGVPHDPSTVIGAMLPNAHQAMWTLPKLDWSDVSLYPSMVIPYRGR